jgi:hypothetical protein
MVCCYYECSHKKGKDGNEKGVWFTLLETLSDERNDFGIND